MSSNNKGDVRWGAFSHKCAAETEAVLRVFPVMAYLLKLLQAMYLFRSINIILLRISIWLLGMFFLKEKQNTETFIRFTFVHVASSDDYMARRPTGICLWQWSPSTSWLISLIAAYVLIPSCSVMCNHQRSEHNMESLHVLS